MVVLLAVNLERHRMTRKFIEETVERQMKQSGKVLSQDFHDVCLFLRDMVSTLPQVLPSHSRDIISSDPMLTGGGDSEDLARIAHMIYTCLKYGKSEDKTLQSLQRVCSLFVGTTNLGTVPSGENVESHMWWEMMPVKKMERMIDASNRTKFRLNPNNHHLDWEDHLPHLLVDGTKPVQPVGKSYYETPKHAEVACERQKLASAVLRLVSVSTNLLKTLRTTQTPPPKRDLFSRPAYLSSTHARTDELFRAGYKFGGFTWINNRGPKQAWTYGVTMKDKLADKPNVQLAFHPEITKRGDSLRPKCLPSITASRKSRLQFGSIRGTFRYVWPSEF